MSGTAEKVEMLLRGRFDPLHLELRDNSAKHVGHRGATSGGGHYHVLIVSHAFEGRELIDRHRMVNETLRELFGKGIHALGLSTLTPREWEERRSGAGPGRSRLPGL